MGARTQARRLLGADLRTSVAEQQCHLVYQPQVDTDRQTVCGVEALLRWQHPLRGTVSPVEFIPLAEETGLIVRLGASVLSPACRDAAAWTAALRVCVNVSAVQFTEGSLVRDLLRAPTEAGLAPDRLEPEITESVLMLIDGCFLQVPEGDGFRVRERLARIAKDPTHVELDLRSPGRSSVRALPASGWPCATMTRSRRPSVATTATSLACRPTASTVTAWWRSQWPAAVRSPRRRRR
jgi:predicted signal transduction protein with EAL and GGDEF domain